MAVRTLWRRWVDGCYKHWGCADKKAKHGRWRFTNMAQPTHKEHNGWHWWCDDNEKTNWLRRSTESKMMRNNTTAMETEATHGDGDDSHYNKNATARVMATTNTDGAWDPPIFSPLELLYQRRGQFIVMSGTSPNGSRTSRRSPSPPPPPPPDSL